MRYLMTIVLMLALSTVSAAEDRIFIATHETIRIVTAYNAGDEKQTDDTPCIGAANTDICKSLEEGQKICAANFVPLGTKLFVDKVGVCTVADRMNRRFGQRVDIAMKKDEYKQALIFGKQELRVLILEEVDTDSRSK